MVDRLALCTGRLCHALQIVVRGVVNADISERRRQAHRLAEVIHLIDQLARAIAKKQPGQNSNCDLFAVVIRVRAGQVR